MDAVFDSSGNVAGNSGGNRLTAWTGQGLANLLAPTTSGIASAGSLLPADSEMGRAIRQATRYSYPANINNYAKIMADADARAAQQSLLGFKDQSELQNYINQQVEEQLKNQGQRKTGGQSWLGGSWMTMR